MTWCCTWSRFWRWTYNESPKWITLWYVTVYTFGNYALFCLFLSFFSFKLKSCSRNRECLTTKRNSNYESMINSSFKYNAITNFRSCLNLITCSFSWGISFRNNYRSFINDCFSSYIYIMSSLWVYECAFWSFRWYLWFNILHVNRASWYACYHRNTFFNCCCNSGGTASLYYESAHRLRNGSLILTFRGCSVNLFILSGVFLR